MKLNIDLSTQEQSVTAKLIPLLQNLNTYSNIAELKHQFLLIIEDVNTVISKEKIYEYKTNLKKYNSIPKLGIYISNIILSGSKLGMDQLK